MLSVFSAAWITAAIGEYLDSGEDTEALLDSELRHTAKIVMEMSLHEMEEELLSRDASGIVIGSDAKQEQVAAETDAKIAFQVWLHPNRLALRTANAPTAPLSASGAGFTNSTTDNEQWRVYSLTNEPTGTVVHVGEHSSVRQEMLQDAAFGAILPLIIVAPIIGVLTWIGVGRVLAPLNRIADQVAHRPPNDFSLIDTAHALRETVPLIEALNRMFTRLSQAFENTRRFTADAAHELRTPLGGMAVQTDVAMLATDEVDRATALAYVKDGIRDMTRLVHQLLTLARWDSESSELERTPVNFADMVGAVVEELREKGKERDIGITFRREAELRILADETALQLIARNIIDNAIRYTPAGGHVDVAIAVENRHATLQVTDTGPGIPPERRARLFQRFYRAGRIDGDGSGLGLSIAHRCVELHHGNITIDSRPQGGLIIIVHLPLTPLETQPD